MEMNDDLVMYCIKHCEKIECYNHNAPLCYRCDNYKNHRNNINKTITLSNQKHDDIRERKEVVLRNKKIVDSILSSLFYFIYNENEIEMMKYNDEQIIMDLRDILKKKSASVYNPCVLLLIHIAEIMLETAMKSYRIQPEELASRYAGLCKIREEMALWLISSEILLTKTKPPKLAKHVSKHYQDDVMEINTLIRALGLNLIDEPLMQQIHEQVDLSSPRGSDEYSNECCRELADKCVFNKDELIKYISKIQELKIKKDCQKKKWPQIMYKKKSIGVASPTGLIINEDGLFSFLSDKLFKKMEHLNTITVDKNVPGYLSSDGCLYSKNGNTTMLIRCPVAHGENVRLHEHTTNIDENAFTKDMKIVLIVNKKIPSIPVGVMSSLKALNLGNVDIELQYSTYQMVRSENNITGDFEILKNCICPNYKDISPPDYHIDLMYKNGEKQLAVHYHYLRRTLTSNCGPLKISINQSQATNQHVQQTSYQQANNYFDLESSSEETIVTTQNDSEPSQQTGHNKHSVVSDRSHEC